MARRELRLPLTAEGRLNRALADALGLGRAAVKQAFAAGAVRVRGRRARASDPAEPGAPVELEVEEEAGPVEADGAVPLRVLAEGEGWLVADKPAGVATRIRCAPARVARSPMPSWRAFPSAPWPPTNPRDGGAVQRLDLETSGCVLFARSPEAWRALRAQLAARTVEKRYLALAQGRVSAGGVCSVPLAPRGGRVVPAPDPERLPKATGKPRPAETHYEVRRAFPGHTLLEVRIVTGVMHQIRAHLAYLGHPVAGDLLYGGSSAALPGLERHFLHAAAVGFDAPQGGRVRAESPLPEELERVLAALGG